MSILNMAISLIEQLEDHINHGLKLPENHDSYRGGLKHCLAVAEDVVAEANREVRVESLEVTLDEYRAAKKGLGGMIVRDGLSGISIYLGNIKDVDFSGMPRLERLASVSAEAGALWLGISLGDEFAASKLRAA